MKKFAPPLNPFIYKAFPLYYSYMVHWCIYKIK